MRTIQAPAARLLRVVVCLLFLLGSSLPVLAAAPVISAGADITWSSSYMAGLELVMECTLEVEHSHA